MRASRSRIIAALAAGLVGALAACGTTVSPQQIASSGTEIGASAPGGLASGGLQAPTSTTPLATGGRGAISGTAAHLASQTGSEGPNVAGRSVPAAESGGSGSGSSTVPLNGPIQIGFEFTDLSDGVYQALSGSTVSAGSPRAAIAAMAAYINSHGGLAGRKIQAVVHSTPYGDALNRPDSASQAACADFTEDHHVFAASIETTYAPLVSCLAHHSAITVSDVYVLDRETFRQLSPFYFAPGAMNLDRGAEAMASRLQDAGWFAHGTVGVLYDETTPFARAKNSLLARLHALGIPVAKTYGITSPAGDLSGAAAQASNAVLAFRSAGINRVLSVDRGGGLFYLFSEAADSQRYYPEYGLNSNNNLAAQESIAPQGQWANVTAVGWSPYDLLSGPQGRDKQRAALCRAILRRAGDTAGSQLLTCDQALFIKSVVDHAGIPALAQFDSAAAHLGSAYQSPFVFSDYLAPGRNDGAATVRLAKYNASCSCLRWASGPSPAQ